MKVLRLKTILRTILLGAFAFLTFSSANAQGNLQFNQVINYDIASNGIQNFTVPSGKVWKIESVVAGNTGSPFIFLRNAALQNIGYFTTPNASVYPFWLGSGFVGSFQNLSTNRSIISILEFNVVP